MCAWCKTQPAPTSESVPVVLFCMAPGCTASAKRWHLVNSSAWQPNVGASPLRASPKHCNYSDLTVVNTLCWSLTAIEPTRRLLKVPLKSNEKNWNWREGGAQMTSTQDTERPFKPMLVLMNTTADCDWRNNYCCCCWWWCWWCTVLPMVEMWDGWNSLSVNLHNKHVFPTPESPRSRSRKSTSYCLAIVVDVVLN